MSLYSNSMTDIDNLPQLEAVQFQPMQKRYAKIVFFETLFFFSLLLLGLIIVDQLTPAEIPIWFLIGFTALTIMISSFVYYSALALGYCLRDKDILYKKGVFWKKQTGVSFKRIQHIELSHGPIERKFDLATIKFFTAGGAHVDLKMSGLTKTDAENLRSHILTITGVSDA